MFLELASIAASALITPFSRGKIDENTFTSLLRRQILNGMNACVPAGTTGESATLSMNEHKSLIELSVIACKNTGVKVIAGAGSNSTAEAIELAVFAQNIGANAILSVAPYYNKPSQRGLYEHFSAIAKSVEIPVILYNVPSRTGVFIEPETTTALFQDLPNVCATKEAHGDLSIVMQLRENSDICVLCGDDALNFAMLSHGARGVISVTGNLLPDKISALVNAVNSGDFLLARALNLELYGINKVLFCESNPAPLKAAMHIAGLLPTLEFRLPLVAPSAQNMKKIEEILRKYEVKT